MWVVKFPRVFGLASSQHGRFLFTNEFLSIDMVKERQKMVLDELEDRQVNIPQFRQRIHASLALPSGISSEIAEVNKSDENPGILSQDLLELIMTSKSKDELKATAQVLQHYASNYASNLPLGSANLKLLGLLKNLVGICHAERDMSMIEPLLKDQDFLDKVGFFDKSTQSLGKNVPTLLTMYYDHLYENKSYDEVIQGIDNLSKISSPVPLPLLILSIMSCLRLNSPESLQKAAFIYGTMCPQKVQSQGRIVHPYALLAYNQGQFVEAYEIVSMGGRRSVINIGLRITFLTKMGRLSDAISLLESTLKKATREDKPQDETGKLIFSQETVHLLTNSVAKSGDNVLLVKLAAVFRQMDSIAAISKQSLFDIVTGPIDATKAMKYRREKNRFLRQQRASSSSCDMEEIEEEEVDHEKSIIKGTLQE